MQNTELSRQYEWALEDLDHFSKVSMTGALNSNTAQGYLDHLKLVRDDINKILLVELDCNLGTPKDYLTENEILCLVYCYFRNDHLRTLINLAYSENVLLTLNIWQKLLLEVTSGINKCLDKLSHGQYEAPTEASFSQVFGNNSNIDPLEFVNERVSIKLLKSGLLNQALKIAGFYAWDKYAYCLRIKHDLVKEEILPYLRKKSVLGYCNYKDAHLMALVFFANDSGFLLPKITFIEALNTIHNSSFPTLRSYNHLLANLNEAIIQLRKELNLPSTETFNSNAAAISSFSGITIENIAVDKLLAFLIKVWGKKSLIATQETLAVILDKMC